MLVGGRRDIGRPGRRSPDARVRLCRYRDPNRHLRRRGGGGGVPRHRSPPSASQVASRLWRRRRRVSPPARTRPGYTEADLRARRAFCLGMLSLIAAASGARSDSVCSRPVTAGVQECIRVYPSPVKPAVICDLQHPSSSVFNGSWSVIDDLPGEVGVTTQVASFLGDVFFVDVRGFTGLADGAEFRSELWPPAGFSGRIACASGRRAKTICLLPPPALHWVLEANDLVTVERRAPPTATPFGDAACRSLGADQGTPRYTRTFWGLNGDGVVGVSEDAPARLSLRWRAERPPGVSLNTSTLSITFPVREEEHTCATCIVGAGDDILSLPAVECRTLRRGVAQTRARPKRCNCSLGICTAVFCASCFSLSMAFFLYACVSAVATPGAATADTQAM
uniref:Protein m164 n=1 Tax=Mastomys natalensis cytomegalovirus 2 TaxID=2973540 RepID=A0A9Y1IM05_9BETA|nr:protein m164 [Mastomys natalensis cytomegalovirus 2]WEG69706.1 protein m164 [Mastomys natalensis cytomegalovirus 2]